MRLFHDRLVTCDERSWTIALLHETVQRRHTCMTRATRGLGEVGCIRPGKCSLQAVRLFAGVPDAELPATAAQQPLIFCSWLGSGAYAQPERRHRRSPSYPQLPLTA